MYKQTEPGVICIFSLKNPSYPEYQCWTSCGVMCIDFHPQVLLVKFKTNLELLSTDPQHPHMMIVGLHDGNIAVYNLQKNTGQPSYQSDARNGKHKDIVWQVGGGVVC